MKKFFKLLRVISIVAVIGFGVAACSNDDNSDDSNDDDGGTGNEQWRESKVKFYTVTDGVAVSVSSEIVFNWIIYRKTSNTDYEYKYTGNQTFYNNDTTPTSGFYSYHSNRTGQIYTYTRETAYYRTESTTTYDSVSGLTLQSSNISTSTSDETTSSYNVSYNIQLLSESGGVKTYKASYNTLTIDGDNIDDVSSYGYEECKVQNGRTIEAKSFSEDGTLEQTTIYTLSDDPIIRAKIGDYTLSRDNYTSNPQSNRYQTVEVLSDSATELVIRQKTFSTNNNLLSGQTDYTYEKVN